ncbi:MAG: hypothetical protein CL840_18105 [Crocinitomicaceae bacterium]|nr:hypothetical protein [Crocinitomicaceae bacterium]|tara:strand:- start:21212 stop:22291 length:1080 start_codon:yes stop_codon:yes gene_type:complete
METNNINNIFDDLTANTGIRSEAELTREWDQLQVDVPELHDIILEPSDFPNHMEVQEIKKKINTIDPNSPLSGLSIMLSVIALFTFSIGYIYMNHLPEQMITENDQISLHRHETIPREISLAASKTFQVKHVQQLQPIKMVPISRNQQQDLVIEEEVNPQQLELIGPQKTDHIQEVHYEPEPIVEDYVYDYNYKYMNNYKIYNYESRLAPPETLTLGGLNPAYSNWGSYSLSKEPIFSNRVYETRLEKAFKYMKKERYREVNFILVSIIKEFPMDQNAWFYLGISNYRQENYKKAKTCFEMILNDQPAVFKPEAEWYKSLCLLNIGEVDVAIEHLRTIARKNGFYQKRAEELLVNHEHY